MTELNKELFKATTANIRSNMLFAFGVIGLAITCTQGLTPFIELAQLINWVVSNWVSWSRAFWSYLLSLFSIEISKVTADLLSGIAYMFSYILAFRRRRGTIYESSSKILCFIKVRSRLVKMAFEAMLYIPIAILYYLLWLSSYYLLISFLVMFILILFSEDVIGTRRFLKIDKIVFGEQVDFYSDWSGASYCFIFMAWYVILIATVVVILNEIGLYGTNLQEFVKWMRCDAGIAC